MKVLYYDTFSGICGDMHLGAMIDAGVDSAYLIEELKKLGLSHEYEIKVTRDARKGITGTKVDVILLNQQEHNHEHLGDPHHHSQEEYQHDQHIHEHEHGEHTHEHHHNHGEEHCHSHEECHGHIHSESQGHNHHHCDEIEKHVHQEHCHEEHIHNHKNHHHHQENPSHEYIHAKEESHSHEHSHGHEHIGVDEKSNHNHSHQHGHSHDHVHRNLYIIEELINNSKLSEDVKKLSIDIFKQVAEAEAKVHGKPLYEVHFHEVGATDSIVDIVGAAICLDYLKVDKVLASPVEVGGGFVKCAHGRMPVPAPATSEILKGVPITTGAVPFETTTPTGAAILKVAVHKFTKDIDFIIDKVAYGVGNRDTEIPNVLRVYLGHYEENEETVVTFDAEEAKELIIECNLDDMNSESYEYIFHKLFKIGVKDVYITPIIMKKGRPAQKLTVLCDYKIQREVEDILLRETTTFGVRKYEVEKVMLNRDFIKINTKYGEVTVKRGFYNGDLIKFKGEYDCCKELAIKNNVALEEIYNELRKVMLK